MRVGSKHAEMSLVHEIPIPELLWFDWVIIFCGLGVGVGAIFEIIGLSCSLKESRERLYTYSNVWLILSGVIHVSY